MTEILIVDGIPLALFQALTPTELRLLAYMLAHGGELRGLGGANAWMERAAFSAKRKLAERGIIEILREPRSRTEPGIYRVNRGRLFALAAELCRKEAA